MPVASQFKYGPSIGADQLRTLTLLSALHYNDKLECKINVALRTNPPPYEALSYRCGDEEAEDVIYINGKSLQIRPNLASALRYLRPTKGGRTLWVDAISINQDERTGLEEKKDQVRLMDKTYENAFGVLVWLGDPSDEEQSSLAMAAISELGRQYHNQSLRDVHDTTLFLPADVGGFGPKTYLHAVSRLLQRGYFERLWVVQEVCLAPADAVTIVCGKDRADFWQLANLQLANLDPRHLNLSEKGVQEVIQECGAFSYLSRPQEPPLVLTRELFAVADRDIPEGAPPIEQTRAAAATLLRHIWVFRKRNCSDPRDKIYAIRSMALDIKAEIEPNYDEAFGITFTKATCAIIRKHHKLNVLGMCIVPEGSTPGGHNRPAWVPDLRISEQIRPFTSLTKVWTDREPYYTAAGNSNTFAMPSHAAPELDLTGYDVGTIAALGIDGVQPGAKAWQEGLIRSWKLVEELAASKELRYDDPQEAFWRTLITNRNSLSEPAQYDTEGVQFNAWWEVLTEKITHPHEKFLVYQKAFIRHFFMRSFFTTKNGFIGLGPAAAMTGDRVALLAGSQVPLVLRPRGDHFQLIGECYVHGCMDGTYWRERKKTTEQAEFTMI